MCKLNILLLFYIGSSFAVLAEEPIALKASYCEIRALIYNDILYNFTKLIKPTEDIIINHEHSNETFRMQLCSPLAQKCNGKDGYAICLIKDKQERGIGKVPPKVINESGKIMFTFTGDECIPNTKYVVNIIMKCDYSSNSYPEIIHATDECNIFMIWRTVHACVPAITQNCTVINNGQHYDLSTLTQYLDNYIIHIGNNTSSQIILNVCHSVIIEYNALCQLKSGVCLKTSVKGSDSKYVNLGDVQKGPFIENNVLKIVYEEGSVCGLPNVSTPHIKTTISFICDLEATDSWPEYVGGEGECHYQLIWKTAAACSIESLHNHSTATAGKCTVTNPLTNFTYNLQSLMNQDFSTSTINGTQYKFRVCGPNVDAICKSGTGVCLSKNKTSMGMANTNLIWQHGGPYLNYTGGEPCGNGQQRYTQIAFVCGAEGSLNKPFIMEEQPCQLIIHWSTDLVCEKRIKCMTDDEEIKLTSLIRSTDNYVVKANNTEFHINVCRPLIPKQSLTCKHGSAACKATLSSNNEYTQEVSLGFPEENPILNNHRQAVLRYVDGSSCPEQPHKSISSNFTFLCDYNNKEGYDIEYKGYNSCTYIFEWRTNVVCAAVMGNWIPPCTVKDPYLSRVFNFSLLYQEHLQAYHVKNKGKEYSISVCGGKKYCNGSAICQGANGYGSLANVIFDYSRDVVKIQYQNGSKCVNSSYTSEIRFICNESAGVGRPSFLWESQCIVEFEWHTNLTCTHQLIIPQSPATDKEENVKFSSSHAGTVAGVVLTVVALLAAILFFRNPDKRACLRSCLNSCGSRRSSGRVQYCRVDTTEEGRLLLDVSNPTQCQTDSDDDLLHA